MIVEGSSALKPQTNPKWAEMEAYLSSEGGYWLQNDILSSVSLFGATPFKLDGGDYPYS